MHKRFYQSVFFLLILLAYAPLQAQDDNPAPLVPLPSRQPSFVVKWAPLSLLTPDPTVQFALEYSLNHNWSIQQELGYGKFPWYTDDSDQPREIWRSRSEIRYHLYPERPNPLEGTYLAFEFMYKRVNKQEERTVGRECEQGNCAYFEQMTYGVFRDVFAYHFKLGRQIILDERFSIDIYTGIGLRHIFTKAPALGSTDDLFWDRDLFTWYNRPGTYTLPSVSAGIKVGYLIFKEKKK